MFSPFKIERERERKWKKKKKNPKRVSKGERERGCVWTFEFVRREKRGKGRRWFIYREKSKRQEVNKWGRLLSHIKCGNVGWDGMERKGK